MPAEQVAGTAADRQQAAEGQGVGGEDPVQARLGDPQAVPDDGQAHGHDGAVHHHEHLRERDHQQGRAASFPMGVRGAAPIPDPDPAGQRRVVNAFLAAARGGDFDALVSVLDPDVVLRADGGVLADGLKVIRGVAAVAGRLAAFQRMATAAGAPVRVGPASCIVMQSYVYTSTRVQGAHFSACR
ncbi:hypothetical protein [Streptosporangium sandarakinum]|uniref:hypothetical protein n=1 Tax=Streptosporangium sandarakinum TaxID=1260955 RepID=UPI00343EC6B9